MFAKNRLKVDDEKLSESIQNKLEEVYSKGVSYEIDQQCIAKTPEGDVVVQSLIDVTLHIKGEDVETGIVLLTGIK